MGGGGGGRERVGVSKEVDRRKTLAFFSGLLSSSPWLIGGDCARGGSCGGSGDGDFPIVANVGVVGSCGGRGDGDLPIGAVGGGGRGEEARFPTGDVVSVEEGDGTGKCCGCGRDKRFGEGKGEGGRGGGRAPPWFLRESSNFCCSWHFTWSW
mmetsp:Transcript_23907/g.37236  ORF Transcript_23907/g.37236 Transcript_23907/m.37236 type:complete len:153 (-) Transcript_23907:510-968(-)